jgi:hypothetical protein
MAPGRDSRAISPSPITTARWAPRRPPRSIDDVQGVKIAHNLIAGPTDKAFSFQNKSTDAVVTANKLDAGIGYEVGMDASSQQGYHGPKIGGAP